MQDEFGRAPSKGSQPASCKCTEVQEQGKKSVEVQEKLQRRCKKSLKLLRTGDCLSPALWSLVSVPGGSAWRSA